MKRTQLFSKKKPHEEEATLVAELLSNEAFSAMKLSGYASTTAWAVYSSAWSSLMTTQVNDDGDDDLLHAQWLKIVQGLVVAAGGFVTKLDNRTISANQRLERYQQNNAMGQFGDLFGITTAKNELQELKESLQSIKNDVKDIKLQFKEGNLRKDDMAIEAATTGIHPITARRQWTFVVLFVAIFGLMAGGFFGLEDLAIAGVVMIVMGSLFLVAAVLMQMPWNPAYNLFEDMILMESQLRKALDEDTIRVSSSNTMNNNDRDMPKALAELRAAMMESYYDALRTEHTTSTCCTSASTTRMRKI